MVTTLNVNIMNEKALMLYVSHIMGNQYAIMDYLSSSNCGGDEAKKQEHFQYMKNLAAQYSKALLPSILESTNLDWDVNDLLKP